MKRYIIRFLLSLILCAQLVSCAEDEIKTYNGCKSGIIIQMVYTTDIYGNPIRYQESTTYSFANAGEDVKEANVRFFVKAVGQLSNKDRKYKIEVEPGDNVTEDDYDLSKNDFTIRANQAADTVNVIVKRSLKLRKETLKLKFNILPNENFEVPVDSFKNSGSWSEDGDIFSGQSYTINFNEKYTQPFYWMLFGDDFFGSFTANRYVLLNQVMGWKQSDWDNAGSQGAKISFGKFGFIAKTFQKYLQKLADEGNPALDDDGTYIQLPEDYKVDY